MCSFKYQLKCTFLRGFGKVPCYFGLLLPLRLMYFLLYSNQLLYLLLLLVSLLERERERERENERDEDKKESSSLYVDPLGAAQWNICHGCDLWDPPTAARSSCCHTERGRESISEDLTAQPCRDPPPPPPSSPSSPTTSLFPACARALAAVTGFEAGARAEQSSI